MSEPAADQNENIDVPLREGEQPVEHMSWRLSRRIRRPLFSGYDNVLLVFVPIGIAAGTFGWPAEAVFVLNFLAIIPLAPLITFSIDGLSPALGRTFGELLRPTSGNAAEMIVGIVAVSRGETHVARTSVLGSILAYALLVLGSSFFIAGYDKKELVFNKTLTNTTSSLMMAVSFALIIPTITSVTAAEGTPDSKTENDIRILSHAISITLLIIFLIYLNFRAWFLKSQNDQDVTLDNHQHVGRALSVFAHGLVGTSCVLLGATLCATACVYHLVGSIDDISNILGFNETFVSLVLIPPVGYASKCVNISAMARRCDVDSVMKSIIYSILQIVLFIIPLLILLGWILDKPFTLDFNIFEGTIFFLALIVMTATIQDGKANYFDGIMLVGTYILIGVAFFVRPDMWENLILPPLEVRKVVEILVDGNASSA